MHHPVEAEQEGEDQETQGHMAEQVNADDEGEDGEEGLEGSEPAVLERDREGAGEAEDGTHDQRPLRRGPDRRIDRELFKEALTTLITFAPDPTSRLQKVGLYAFLDASADSECSEELANT
jgi:hypothetical protein